MADTLIRLRAIPGATVDTQVEDEQGRVYYPGSGTFAPLVLATWSDTVIPTPEDPTGSGRYVLDFAGLVVGPGLYLWTHYYRGPGGPGPDATVAGYGERYWDGSTFTPTPPAPTTFDGLAVFGSVTGSAPTDRQFVITLTGSAPVPDDGDWLTLFACFTSGRNAQAKRAITGYAKVTETTAMVTVGSPFPAAPEVGDALTIL